METTVSFGYWIRRQRKALDLTQQELAEQVSCSLAAIKKIEGDERRPSRQIAERLAEVLGVSTDQREMFLEVARGLRSVDQLSLAHAPAISTETSSLPSGTVTFLFTDIEGSTKLAQQYSDAMPALLTRHHEILHQSIQRHNGYVFQVVGDEFAAAFHSANDALDAALNAQHLLQNEDGSPATIKVRMGIHTGMAQLQDASKAFPYSGYATIALTQRIMSAGHGGQILLSQTTQDLVEELLSSDVALLDLGEHHLKDFLHPTHLYQVTVSDLPADFPPLNTLDSTHHNLPAQLTSFIGREKEIEDVIHLLRKSRLVTLTGPGGTGKTRLAIQVAYQLLDHYPDGVWLVELAPILDPLLVPRITAIAIGLRDEPRRPIIEMLCDYLREKKPLLILDNCEHLIEACAQLADTILHACPTVHILTSSREALGIAGEKTYLVPSLTLPDIQNLPPVTSLSQYEAIQLFLDRAASAIPKFILTDENVYAIAQICQRLDGIPLAIELAAGKMRALGAAQIAQRLDDRFHLLTGGSRTALPRHQTLQAAIDWSYNLLSRVEQILFRRLSVFVGGWTLEAAEEVCAGEEVEPSNILDLLAQLVNKSLVIVIEDSQSGETRYRMLETIRQYAREKLLEAGGTEPIRAKHLAYFLKLAEQAEPELYRSNQLFWLNKLDDELGNFRVAMEWVSATSSKSGLRLIIALRYFWTERGDNREVQNWLAQLLEQYEEVDSLRARALAVYGYLEAGGGDLAHAQIIANQSLELSRSIPDRYAEAVSLEVLGSIILRQGDLEQGIPIVEHSLALYQSFGDKLGQAQATRYLSLNHNDLERSKSLLFESLKLYRELGNLSRVAYCLNELALRVIWGGRFASAGPWLEEAIAIFRQLGNEIGEALVLATYGLLTYWSGDYQKACEYFEAAIVLDERSSNFTMDALWSRVHMAYTRLRQNNIPRAKELFERSAKGFLKAGNMIGFVYATEGLASLYVSQNQPEHAARLFAWADVMRDKIDDHRPSVEQASVERDFAVIHSQLNDDEFANLSIEGRALTLEQAIALVTEDKS